MDGASKEGPQTLPPEPAVGLQSEKAAPEVLPPSVRRKSFQVPSPLSSPSKAHAANGERPVEDATDDEGVPIGKLCLDDIEGSSSDIGDGNHSDDDG